MRGDTLNWYFWMKAINIPSKQGLHMKGLFSASACWIPLLGCACAVVHVVLLVKLHNTGIFQGSARNLIVAVVRFHRTCCNEYEPRPYLFVLWPAFSCYSLSLSAQGPNRWSNNKPTTTSFIIFLLLRISIPWKILVHTIIIWRYRPHVLLPVLIAVYLQNILKVISRYISSWRCPDVWSRTLKNPIILNCQPKYICVQYQCVYIEGYVQGIYDSWGSWRSRGWQGSWTLSEALQEG